MSRPAGQPDATERERLADTIARVALEYDPNVAHELERLADRVDTLTAAARPQPVNTF